MVHVFDLAFVLLCVCGFMISSTWRENYGGVDSNGGKSGYNSAEEEMSESELTLSDEAKASLINVSGTADSGDSSSISTNSKTEKASNKSNRNHISSFVLYKQAITLIFSGMHHLNNNFVIKAYTFNMCLLEKLLFCSFVFQLKTQYYPNQIFLFSVPLR